MNGTIIARIHNGQRVPPQVFLLDAFPDYTDWLECEQDSDTMTLRRVLSDGPRVTVTEFPIPLDRWEDFVRMLRGGNA